MINTAYTDRWNTKRLGFLFAENSEKNLDLVCVDAYQFCYGNIVPKKKYEMTEDLAETYCKYTVVEPNDIMINGLNLNYDFVSQRVALVEKKGIMTSAYICLRPRILINAKYYSYLFKALDARKVFHGLGTGIRLTLSYDAIKNLTIPVPPRQEQDQVVCFLDWKVSEINRLVNIKKREIAGLNDLKTIIINKAVTQGINDNISLKDSGVPWIGKIPYEWNIVKLGRCTRSISDIDHYMPNSVDDGFPYVMTGDLKPKVSQIDLNKCKMVNEFEYRRLRKKSKAEKGDLIFARYATIGTVCYVDVDAEFLTSYSCVVIKVERHLLGEFLFYYMQSSPFFEDVNQYIKINTQGNVGKATLQMVKIPLPTFSEQQEIVAYLDKQTEKIDQLSDIKKKEVNALQEYKTRLISDAVTGQIDLRDIAIPEYEYVEESADMDSDSADELDEAAVEEVS